MKTPKEWVLAAKLAPNDGTAHVRWLDTLTPEQRVQRAEGLVAQLADMPDDTIIAQGTHADLGTARRIVGLLRAQLNRKATAHEM
jgi:hypothetical protein